jgi:signal peptidase I
MSISNPIRRKYLGYLVYLLPIAIIVLGYFAVVVATGESEPFTIVTGTSMEPTIMPASIALIDNVPFNKLKLGEVIVFVPQVAEGSACDAGPPLTSPSSETSIPCYVIHRIVSIQTLDNGSRILTTKGDNNPYSYPGIDTNITETMYKGMVVLQFPVIGYVTFPPYNEYLAFLIIVVLIAEIASSARKSLPSRHRL